MKQAFTASILLNLVLLICMVAPLAVRKRETTTEAVQMRSSNSEEAGARTTPRPAEKTFHWSEIESEDYRTYLANLRRIGCPELTIQDIIRADVDNLYARRRRELEKPANLNPPTGEKEIKMRALRDEETWVLATLLGEKPTNEPSGASASVPPRVQRYGSREQRFVMPLVLQEVDRAKLNLNHDQVEAISDLRQRFLDEIGGPAQNPGDPGYAERWRRSQPEIDNDLRGMIGVAAFQDYQIEAADVVQKSQN